MDPFAAALTMLGTVVLCGFGAILLMIWFAMRMLK